MSDQHVDPSGNTAQFRAFVQRPEPAPAKRSPLPIVAGVVAALVVIAVIVWLIAS